MRGRWHRGVSRGAPLWCSDHDLRTSPLFVRPAIRQAPIVRGRRFTRFPARNPVYHRRMLAAGATVARAGRLDTWAGVDGDGALRQRLRRRPHLRLTVCSKEVRR